MEAGHVVLYRVYMARLKPVNVAWIQVPSPSPPSWKALQPGEIRVLW
jgi:hypothetical protein